MLEGINRPWRGRRCDDDRHRGLGLPRGVRSLRGLRAEEQSSRRHCGRVVHRARQRPQRGVGEQPQRQRRILSKVRSSPVTSEERTVRSSPGRAPAPIGRWQGRTAQAYSRQGSTRRRHHRASRPLRYPIRRVPANANAPGLAGHSIHSVERFDRIVTGTVRAAPPVRLQGSCSSPSTTAFSPVRNQATSGRVGARPAARMVAVSCTWRIEVILPSTTISCSAIRRTPSGGMSRS